MFSTTAAPRNRLTTFLNHTILRQFTTVLLGSLLIAASAQIVIPYQPVPFTLQSTAVLLLGLTLGPRFGAASVLVYLAQAAAGLPVLAHGTGGIASFVSPTAGYLYAFAPAAFVTGWIMEQGGAQNWLTILFSSFVGTGIIMLGGFIGLSSIVGMSEAWMVGVAPFLVTEPLKLALVSTIAMPCWTLSDKSS